MSDAARINGNQHSWGSIILKCGGARFTGFTSIKYADSRERVKAWGLGRHQAPRGRSRGKYSTEPVVLGGWKASLQELREELAILAPDGKSYGDVVFDVIVQYVEAGDKSCTDQILGCVITKNSMDAEEGGDPLKEEIELDCMRIIRNGTTLYDSSVDQP